MANLSDPSKLEAASQAICCTVFPVISSNGINLFACIESFSIPMEVKCCSMSMTPDPISAGTTTGLETCILNFPPPFACLKSAGLIERKRPPSLAAPQKTEWLRRNQNPQKCSHNQIVLTLALAKPHEVPLCLLQTSLKQKNLQEGFQHALLWFAQTR
nr:hypothetical protein DEO72_LG10g2500 [Ipomoea batatas]